MTLSWNRIPALGSLGLGLAATLLLCVAGCGGKGTDSGDAVLVPEPNANVPTVGSTESTTTTSTANAPAATSKAAPAAVKAEGWGTLKGQITLKGNPPEPKVLAEKGKASKDPEVCAKETSIKSERLVVDAASKGVKNVLVYIPKPTAVNEEAKSNVKSAQVVFDQTNCTFEPHVLALMEGVQVSLKNSDPVNHNINSRLKNNAFNKLLSGSQEMPQPIVAPERSPGEVTCDIHPWMKAYWLVLDNPYFAVTDEKGNFEIKNVPAGTQKVVVWQEAVAPNGFVTSPSGDAIELKANDAATKNFEIDASKLRAE